MKTIYFLFLRIFVILMTVYLITFHIPKALVWDITNANMLLLFFASLPLGIDKKLRLNYDMTVTTDAWFVAGICILAFLTGFRYWYIYLFLLSIPCIDIFRYMWQNDKKEPYKPSKRVIIIAIIQSFIMMCLLGYIYILGFKTAGTSEFVAFALGVVFSLIAILIPSIAPHKIIPQKERSISLIAITLPLALFVWPIIFDIENHEARYHSYAVGIMAFIIILLGMIQIKPDSQVGK